MFRISYRRVFVIFFVLCALPLYLSANASEITGTVIDKISGKSVTGATITIVEIGIKTVTDSSGFFNISCPAISFELTVSSIAYKTVRRNITAADSKRGIIILVEPEIISFKDVNVTAGRYLNSTFSQARSISMADAALIDKRPAATTADALSEEPGITVQKTTHGHGAPIMRGLMGNYILLMYNGIRLNKPSFRYGPNQYLNTTDLKSMDNIEVVRGPLSVLYGSDAMGGVVNLIAGPAGKRSSSLHVNPVLTSRYSSTDEGLMTNVGFDLVSRHSYLRLGSRYGETGNLRAGGDVGRQKPTGWDEKGFNVLFRHDLDDSKTIGFDFIRLDQNRVPRYDKYFSGGYHRYLYEPQKRTLVSASLKSESPDGRQPSYMLNLSYQSEIEGRIKQKIGETAVTRETDEVKTWGGMAQFSWYPSRLHHLVTGLETYHDRVDSRRTLTDNDEIFYKRPAFPDGSGYQSWGFFAEDTWQIQDRLQLVLGLRYSYFRTEAIIDPPYGDFRQSYHDITAAISSLYRLKDDWQAYLSAAKGFRAPNWDDAIVLKETNQGIDAPNTDLAPEYCLYYEIGTKYRGHTLDASAAFFANTVYDLIDRRPGAYLGLDFYDVNENGIRDEAELQIYQKKNVGEAIIFGTEYFARLKISTQWSVWSTLQWTRGKNLTDNEPLSRIPPLTGQIGVNWCPVETLWSEFFIRAAGSQRRVSARDADDSRIGPQGTDGWITFNLRLEYRWGLLKANLLLENLTDELYKTHGSGIYSPGRGIAFRLTFNPGSTANEN